MKARIEGAEKFLTALTALGTVVKNVKKNSLLRPLEPLDMYVAPNSVSISDQIGIVERFVVQKRTIDR